MKSTDIEAMFKEYNNGGDFAHYVNRCIENYGTDVVDELHKVITFEYYKYLKGLPNNKDS